MKNSTLIEILKKRRETRILILKKHRRTKHGLLSTMYNSQKLHSKTRGMPPPKYSLQELRSHFLNDSKFLALYAEWEKSNFKKDLKPSIDRLLNSNPYTIENIQIMTWKEHKIKSSLENSIKKYKPVLMISLENKPIKIFKSIASACEETGCYNSAIIKCCLGEINSSGGYRWKYA